MPMNERRVPGYPGLDREDLGKEGNRFRIVITRGKKITQEYFYIKEGADEAKVRDKAIQRWEEIRRVFPVLTRATFAQVERRKSPSGMVGVRRIVSIVKDHPYEFWIAVWSDHRGNRRMRSFSINKYGEKAAKQLATKARREGLEQMGD